MQRRRARAVIGTVGIVAVDLALSLTAGGIAPAVAADGPGNQYFLTNGTTGGAADLTFTYGRADDVVQIGDWNGDGTDTLGVRRGNQYLLTNDTKGGTADLTFAYGRAGDVVLVGDWNGDGTDTLGVRRDNQYYLTNGTTGGAADISFAYGKPGDVVLVGDWNGDGTDTLGVRRGSQYFLTNGTTGGAADISFAYGKLGDVVLVGDWNGDGTNTLGVRRGSSYHLTNGTKGGAADLGFVYGRADDVVLVGDWNGDGTDTLGIRRPVEIRSKIPAMPPGVERKTYAVPSEVKPGLYRSLDVRWSDCAWSTVFSDGWVDTHTFAMGSTEGDPTYVQIGPQAIRFTQIAYPQADGTIPHCGGWTEALPTDPVAIRSSGGNGAYRLGIDVNPGTYRFAAGRPCRVEVVRDFEAWPIGMDNRSAIAAWDVSSYSDTTLVLKHTYGGVAARGYIFSENCSWVRV
ncbi:hypothetical protein SAMN05428970_1911 [Agromyces sp. CF514]|uniref:hypothetical protein n=1 Tax=Agromyces sp. CF514 TaxID=1881031 RepID=UPI0008E6BC21|nr:hypothetical protein [Agromyces sp. CF514]SFR75422.1 hypothetical protein SAMN05428970_1911 [Agromyces sp. CF514]